MRKLVSFMHISLDGFAATPKGEMNWINISDDIFNFSSERTNAADIGLYGRLTYELMDAYWPTAADQPGATPHDIEHAAWYKKVDKVVLSRTMKEKDGVKIVSANIAEEIMRIKKGGDKEIIMFGSPSTVSTLIQENLVDELWLFINPVLLGAGIPLFREFNHSTKLKLRKNHTFPSGVVGLHYEKL